jgi:hypothetical protein
VSHCTGTDDARTPARSSDAGRLIGAALLLDAGSGPALP